MSDTEDNDTLELTEDVDAGADHVTLSVSGIEISVPRKFRAGHVLDERDALALDSFYRARFVSNMRSAIERDGKSYTAEQLVEKYSTYKLGAIRTPGEGAVERAKHTAALRVVEELFAEHNAKIAAGEPGLFGPDKLALPTGKGSKEAKDVFVQKILASPKYSDRVQAHVDAIMSEKRPKKDASVKSANAASIEF